VSLVLVVEGRNAQRERIAQNYELVVIGDPVYKLSKLLGDPIKIQYPGESFSICRILPEKVSCRYWYRNPVPLSSELWWFDIDAQGMIRYKGHLISP
jgi:hypothetical protein